jgi:hypothetical protein
MCGSIGGGTGGGSSLSILSNVLGGMAQQQQAQAQAKAQIEIGKRQADDEYRRRVANAIYAMQESDLAQTQANDSATQSKMEIARDMLRAREEAKAAASAAGVAGNTLNRLVADISVTEQQKRAVVDSNRENIVHTQQLQKHKAIQSTHMDPFYYTEPGGGWNSMLGIVPALFSGFNFNFSSSGCAPSRSTTSCR